MKTKLRDWMQVISSLITMDCTVLVLRDDISHRK